MEFLLHTPDITNHNIGSVSWNVCHSCILQEKIWILQDRTGWKSFITGFPQGFVFEVSSVDFIRHWIWEGMFLILKKFFSVKKFEPIPPEDEGKKEMEQQERNEGQISTPHLSISLVIPVSRLKFVSGGDSVCECFSSSLWGKQATVKTLGSVFSLSGEFLYLVCKICFVFCLLGGKISFTSSLGMNPNQQRFWWSHCHTVRQGLKKLLWTASDKDFNQLRL